MKLKMKITRSILSLVLVFTTLMVSPVIASASNTTHITSSQQQQDLELATKGTAQATKNLINQLTPDKSELISATSSFSSTEGPITKSIDLVNKKRIEALLKNPRVPQATKDILQQNIVTSIKLTVTEIPCNTPGDPYVQGSYTWCNYLGMACIEYTVGQSFYYDGTNVTYVSTPINNPQTFMWGWSVSNVTNSLSSPIPYPTVASENEAVFSGSVPIIGLNLYTAHIYFHFTFYGNGTYVVTPNIF